MATLVVATVDNPGSLSVYDLDPWRNATLKLVLPFGEDADASVTSGFDSNNEPFFTLAASNRLHEGGRGLIHVYERNQETGTWDLVTNSLGPGDSSEFTGIGTHVLLYDNELYVSLDGAIRVYQRTSAGSFNLETTLENDGPINIGFGASVGNAYVDASPLEFSSVGPSPPTTFGDFTTSDVEIFAGSPVMATSRTNAITGEEESGADIIGFIRNPPNFDLPPQEATFQETRLAPPCGQQFVAAGKNSIALSGEVVLLARTTGSEGDRVAFYRPQFGEDGFEIEMFGTFPLSGTHTLFGTVQDFTIAFMALSDTGEVTVAEAPRG